MEQRKGRGGGGGGGEQGSGGGQGLGKLVWKRQIPWCNSWRRVLVVVKLQ